MFGGALMPRDIPSSIVTALESGEFSPFYAVELNFYNGETDAAAPMYLWTGQGNLSANSKTYVGAGDLLSVGNIAEAAELKATGLNLSLTGVPDALLTAALAHEYSGRDCKVYFGIMGNQNLVEVFTGYMDTMTINDGPDASGITLTVENRLIDLERTNPFRYTQESHKTLYSNDTFFSYVSDLQDQAVEWGPK
jgi:hypothetical protein